MMTRFVYIFLLFSSTFCLFPKVYGQSIAVGGIIENPARSLQLAGKIDSSISFCSRPFSTAFFATKNGVYANNDQAGLANLGLSFPYLNELGKFVLLPINISQQFNTHHPYGWNDGAMIAANGYQAIASLGVYASLGPLELQLQPEFVYAANAPYDTTTFYGSYASGVCKKIFPGQSSIRVSAFSLSAGFSTENLWWGPGIHSALVMSNNASGFLHGFFRSQKPVRSGVGNFEWQLIGGRLSSDPSLPYENANLKSIPLGETERYLSALMISYQPKWIPGLFLGMTRAIQRYRSDVNKSGAGFLNKYIPVLFKAFDKQNAAFDDTMRTDQLASFFLRWAFLKSKAEFYFEYGLNDYNYNTRDYLMSPTHSAAFIVGAKKVFPLIDDSYLDLGIEIVQMSESPDRILRPAGNWYTHSQIEEGYTHENQILGAGAGLGANVQSLTGTWVKGQKRLGALLERVNRDPVNHPYKWIDFSIGLLPQWDFGHIILSAKFQFINSSQYAWQQGVNKFNFHSRIGFQYQF